MQRIRGVIFDLFGTLTDGRLEAERCPSYVRLAAILGAPESEFVHLMSETFPARCGGSLGDVRGILCHICSRLGVAHDDTALDHAVTLRLEIERRLATPRHDAIAVLQDRKSVV